jgi:adenylate cyclase
MRRRRPRWRAGLMLAVGLGSAALWLIVWATGGLHRLELDTVDARFALRGTQPASGVAAVLLDDRTLGELAERPPIRRSHYAKVVDRLHAAGARLIVLDVQFTEQTEPEEDGALIHSLVAARPTVLGSSEVDEHGDTNVLGGVEAQRRFGVRVGSVNFRLDPGGIYRRVPYAVDGLPSLAVVAAGTVERRPAPFDSLWIDYAGPPGTVPELSFVDVMRGRFRAAAVRGRIVVVGASAPTLQDVHPTSTSGRELMSGAEIQANAIATVLRGRPLREAPWWLGALLIAGCAAIVPLAGLRLAPLPSEALGLAAGIVLAGGVQLAFGQGLILPLVAPLGALACAAAGALAVHYVASAVERERTRDLFARFVPEPVVNELLARTDGRLLGGVRRDGTVLFCDLRGFTALAERIEPSEVIDVLNRYLGEMSEAVIAHGGTLVSYLGDGIMAVFGAPLVQEDHADRALAAAREMLGERLERFNAWLVERGLGEPLAMGVGVNSGDVMSGHVGSERRVEYAAVGDTTNLASRLEAMTVEAGVSLLVGASTRARLRHPPADLRELGELPVRGRAAPVIAYTI